MATVQPGMTNTMACISISRPLLACVASLILLGSTQTSALRAEPAPPTASDGKSAISTIERDVEKMSKAASELGSSIGDAADKLTKGAVAESQKAYEWSKRKGSNAYDWSKKQINELAQ